MITLPSSTHGDNHGPYGIFKRTSDGYAGTIRTLTLDSEVVIVTAASSNAGNAPDYRVLAGGH